MENEIEINNTKKTNKVLAMMKAHKLLTVAVMMAVVMVASVSAYWIFYNESAAIYTITGGGDSELILSTALDDINFLVNETENVYQIMEFSNQNGPVEMSFTVLEEFSSNNEACNFTGDITFEYFDQNNDTIISGDNITMETGYNIFSVNASVINQRACDGFANITLTFAE